MNYKQPFVCTRVLCWGPALWSRFEITDCRRQRSIVAFQVRSASQGWQRHGPMSNEKLDDHRRRYRRSSRTRRKPGQPQGTGKCSLAGPRKPSAGGCGHGHESTSLVRIPGSGDGYLSPEALETRNLERITNELDYKTWLWYTVLLGQSPELLLAWFVGQVATHDNSWRLRPADEHRPVSTKQPSLQLTLLRTLQWAGGVFVLVPVGRLICMSRAQCRSGMRQYLVRARPEWQHC